MLWRLATRKYTGSCHLASVLSKFDHFFLGRVQPHKSHSSLSCPPELKQQSSRKSSDATTEVSFNETLRWLPFIAKHSSALPPITSNTRLHGPTVSRLNSNSLTESNDEEEERIAIYKMNRRKRYLAAQQTLLELYPDTKVYATDEPGRSDISRLPTKTPIFPHTDPLDPTKSSNTFELAVPSFANHKDKLMAQKVL